MWSRFAQWASEALQRLPRAERNRPLGENISAQENSASSTALPELVFYKGRHGIFAHFASDECIGRSLQLYGEWGEDELALLRDYIRPGSTVLDVGANVGTHTLPLANMVGERGTVIAIEAQPEVYELLCHNIIANGLRHRIRPIQMLAGDRVATVPYFGQVLPQNLGARSFVREYSSQAHTGTLTLPMAPIDTLPIQNCSLMKVDVEAMEHVVLRGAVGLLKAQRPTVYFEHASGDADALAAIHGLLTGLGYRLYWHFAKPFQPNNFNGYQDDIFGGAVEINVLACADMRVPPGLAEITDPFVPPPLPARDAAPASGPAG